MASDPRSTVAERIAYGATVVLLIVFCLFCFWFYLVSCGLVITL